MNILYEEIRYISNNEVSLFIAGVVFLVLGIVLIWLYSDIFNEVVDKESAAKLLILLLIPSIGLIIMMSTVFTEENVIYATFDENTTFNEITDNYEIVEQRNDLYLLIERNEE